MSGTTETTAAPKNRELQIGQTYEGECVNWIDDGFGYGFIRVVGITRNTFVSGRDLANIDRLRRGDYVRFEAALDRSGRMKCIHCELLES
jgi:cold shock CspA family protein